MRRLNRHLHILIDVGVAGLLAAVTTALATAATTSPDGFSFSARVIGVDENVGTAEISVTRGGPLGAARVRYHTPPLASQTAIANVDYTPVGGGLSFAAGQSTATIPVRIKDHGVGGQPSKTFYIALYGAHGTPLGRITESEIRIVDTDKGTTVAKSASNPLGLATAPTNGNPLQGVTFFVDKKYGSSAIEARAHPQWASKLDVIADEPIAMRFVASNTGAHPGLAVERFLERAENEEPNTVPEISTYRLLHKACASSYKGPGHGQYSDTTGQVKSYEAWINSLANGISTNRAVVYLEIDGLITTTCLGPTGLERRIQELSYAVNRFSKLPRAAVYVDAGAGDALPAATDAKLLNAIGVRKIQGFFLNATHYDLTSKEIRYGQQVSKLTGGSHFVVNTAVNGRGPLVPKNRVKDGDEVRCNPAGRGLGPKPTTNTGYTDTDAFVWIGNPGLSTGTCGDPRDNPPTGVYDLPYALSLVANAVFTVH